MIECGYTYYTKITREAKIGDGSWALMLALKDETVVSG